MQYFIAFLFSFAQVLLGFFQLVLFIYAIMSWIPDIDGDNVFVRMVVFIAEPLLLPARILLSRFESLSSFPIDLSFFLTYLVLIILESAITGVFI